MQNLSSPFVSVDLIGPSLLWGHLVSYTYMPQCVSSLVYGTVGFFSIPPGINISSLSAAGVRFFKRVQSAAAGQLEELLKSEKPAFELDISLSV